MKCYATILMLLVGLAAQAQDFRSWQYLDRYYSLQIGTGQAMYFGELKHNYKLQNGLSHLSIGLEARLTSRIAARVELYGFKLNGYDHRAPDSSYAKQRNLSFHSINGEANLLGVFFFKKYNGEYHKRDSFDPYIAAGIGAMYFKPKTYQGEEELDLPAYRTEGIKYNQFALVFPIALGVKLRINEFINFNVEGSFRITQSDYLDDVSGTFADSYTNNESALIANRKDEIGIINQEAYDQLVPGGKRGDPSKNDHYAFLSFKVELFLPPGLFKGGRGSLLKKSSSL